MQVYVSLYWFRCREKGGGEKPRAALHYLKEERGDHTGHKETPTTRASPFIVHNTSLFTLRPKSVHVVYSNQLIATEALDKGLQNKRKDVCRLVSNPFLQIQRGEGRETGRRQGTSFREKGNIPTT